ncbi:PEP-CTERM sorting domain-containing protein [Sphingoaurantiacus capsulatus]|uniref:PEP-CTERM sorting domain-containing protein n=1 Tax=Sphingoaurantiacus capsulatus TaxID=1771310 RepID=A0ABV7X891_9SPHN
MRKLSLLAAATALATALAAAMPALAAPTYTLTDIGDLAGGSNYSVAYGINNLGQVVGSSIGASGQQIGFSWTNGVMTALPNLPGGNNYGTLARGINDSGQIVGSGIGLNGSTPVNRGIVWQNGVATSMGDLPGGGDLSQGWGINASGQVAGTSAAASGTTSALWQNGSLTNLGDLPGAASSQGLAVNSSGHVVGVTAFSGTSKATLFVNGQATDLGDLPGGAVSSVARGISDAGHIVGQSITTNGSTNVTHAFMLINGVMTDLGDLAGGTNQSIAFGVNSAGRVAGYGFDSVGSQATMWFDSQIFSLASLVSNLGGWRLIQATAINERGQIVGSGTLGGVTRAFLLTPDSFDDAVAEVPEPAALGLFGLGLAALRLRRRRAA